MIIYLWIAKNNDQICVLGLFLQIALVEYIGVYSDTNKVIAFISYKHYKFGNIHYFWLIYIASVQNKHSEND